MVKNNTTVAKGGAEGRKHEIVSSGFILYTRIKAPWHLMVFWQGGVHFL